ncbi:uncharacterized protein LOC121039607 isoform X1 [Herpailurus yagouaroundi]|uniref:uncharacterized protein LOC121039607 isoform X1 n=1 Tax=Herpailurus yagouaroundi TaxID=1608482 RepID=UPI001AD6EF0E|nr:uncharacterized protein LOC121039607 isoform X1 [Puma yagouaroundi]
MAPKRAKSSSGPLGPLQKEILQVSASSGEMRVRPQNCTGTNSSLNLVLIPTWVLTERPEECNPAHPVAARWSARNRRNVEEGQPPSRACGPRKSWPDWLNPASCTVLLPLTSSPPTGQTTPALGHQLGGPTERKLSKALPRCLLHHVRRPPVLHPCGALCKAWPLSCKAGRDGAWGRCYGWLRGYLRRRDSGLGRYVADAEGLGERKDDWMEPHVFRARDSPSFISCHPQWASALKDPVS